MRILPQIHRTLVLDHSAEHKRLCGLQRNFMQMELTRVKGSDIAQCSAIPMLRPTALTHLAAGKRLCAVSIASNVPQGEL
jgi:hypothetical protein